MVHVAYDAVAMVVGPGAPERQAALNENPQRVIKFDHRAAEEGHRHARHRHVAVAFVARQVV